MLLGWPCKFAFPATQSTAICADVSAVASVGRSGGKRRDRPVGDDPVEIGQHVVVALEHSELIGAAVRCAPDVNP
jgi:hypothetical protein